MCGRARCSLNHEDFSKIVNIPPNKWIGGNKYVPKFNAQPGNATPVIVNNGGQLMLHTMTWGLIPSYNKQQPNFFQMMNARSETVSSKNAFRRLVNRRRCVVVFQGFYEWKEDASRQKQPYYLHYSDHRLMKMAGLFDVWRPSGKKRALDEVEEKEEELHTYTILTTAASPALEWLHDRMPVLLDDDQVAQWLDTEHYQMPDILPSIIRGNQPDIAHYPVDKKMNKASYDGPDCVAPIELKPASPSPKITSFFVKQDTGSTSLDQQFKKGHVSADHLEAARDVSKYTDCNRMDKSMDPHLKEAFRRSLQQTHMQFPVEADDSKGNFFGSTGNVSVDHLEAAQDESKHTDCNRMGESSDPQLEEVLRRSLQQTHMRSPAKDDSCSGIVAGSCAAQAMGHDNFAKTLSPQNNSNKCPAISVRCINQDILKCSAMYICHQTNCVTRSARGLAKAIFEKYPNTNIYKSSSTPRIPGEIIIGDIGTGNQYVVHLFGQQKPGPSKNLAQKKRRLKWFEECLEKLSFHVNCNPGTVAFPYYIGCGLAGGVWSDYLAAIENFASCVGSQVIICKVEDLSPSSQNKTPRNKTNIVQQQSSSKKRKPQAQSSKQRTLQSYWIPESAR